MQYCMRMVVQEVEPLLDPLNKEATNEVKKFSMHSNGSRKVKVKDIRMNPLIASSHWRSKEKQ